jgi:hypothetical protein
VSEWRTGWSGAEEEEVETAERRVSRRWSVAPVVVGVPKLQWCGKKRGGARKMGIFSGAVREGMCEKRRGEERNRA